MPMPSNAAGEWIAFSAADPKTWPESGYLYLCERDSDWGRLVEVWYWDNDRLPYWIDRMRSYARILPPGESPEEGK